MSRGLPPTLLKWSLSINFARMRTQGRMISSTPLLRLDEKSTITTNCMKLPIVGLGTRRIGRHDIPCTLETAFRNCYKHIDTAESYKNEKAIGEVLERLCEGGLINREDIFITTKLPQHSMDACLIQDALEESLRRLRLSFVDLYLIEFPVGLTEGPALPGNAKGESPLIPDPDTNLCDIWREMEKLVEIGITKFIGLSNFNVCQIEQILENATIYPAALQIEMHLYMQQQELRSYCKCRNIAVIAYAPLGAPYLRNTTPSAALKPSILEDPVVCRIAKEYNKCPSQIALRFLLQLGVAVIPKSVNTGRIITNMNLFNFCLSEEDMCALRKLDKGDTGRIYDHTIFRGMDCHPLFPFTKKPYTCI